MFYAFVIACAANANFEVDVGNCYRMDDTWGPYVTELNCNIRSNQINQEVLNGTLKQSTLDALGSPEMIYSEPHCTFIALDPAV